MSWTYRVRENKDCELYEIVEYYMGEPFEGAWSHTEPGSGTLEGLRWQLEEMLKALDKPILRGEDAAE